MASLVPDPTIRRAVMGAAHEILRDDPEAPVARITTAAGVSRATFYRHFGSRADLLASVAHEPRPNARTRILGAAQEILVRRSVAELSMDDVARAAGVSRGTLYRIFPGKPALLRGLIETYAPFEAMRRIVREHRDEPPEIVLPLIAGQIVGVAGERLGLMRAMFHEATLGSGAMLAGARPVLGSAIADVSSYLAGQMAAGRLRKMHPLLALQACIGPVFFHLLTRPVVEDITPLPMGPEAAVDDLVNAVLDGLRP
jgi:AcrR family transcriptional regulator